MGLQAIFRILSTGAAAAGAQQLQQAIQDVSKAFNQLGQVISAVRQVGIAFYQALIRANEELQKQVNQTSISFAQSVRTFTSFGDEISDRVSEIKALRGEFKALIRELDIETRGIVGATDRRTREVLRNITLQAQELTNQEKGFDSTKESIKQLTISLTSAFGALDLPDFQIPQEIRALLTGDVNNPNAALARQLQISRQELEKAKGEGRLIQFITEKTNTILAGNVVQARTLANSFSNIQNIVETINLKLGEAAFPAVEDVVADFAGALAEQEDGIIEFAAKYGEIISDLIALTVDRFNTLAKVLAPAVGIILGLGDALLSNIIPAFIAIDKAILGFTKRLFGLEEGVEISANAFEISAAAAVFATKQFNRAARAASRAGDIFTQTLDKIPGINIESNADLAKEDLATVEREAKQIRTQLRGLRKLTEETARLDIDDPKRKIKEKQIIATFKQIRAAQQSVSEVDFGIFDEEGVQADRINQQLESDLGVFQNIAKLRGIAVEESLTFTGNEIVKQGSRISLSLREITNGFNRLSVVSNELERTNVAKKLIKSLDAVADQGGESLDFIIEKLQQLAEDETLTAESRLAALGSLQKALKQQENQITKLLELEKARQELAKFDPGTTAIQNALNQIESGIDAAEQRIIAARKQFETLAQVERVELERRQKELNEDLADAIKNNNKETEKTLREELSRLEGQVANIGEKGLEELEKAIDKAIKAGTLNLPALQARFRGVSKAVIEQIIELKKLELQYEKTLKDKPTQVFEAAQKEFAQISRTANAEITEAVTEREIEVQKLLNKGLITEKEVAAERLKVTKERTDAELELARQQLNQLEQLELSDDPEERAKQELAIQEAKNKVGKLTLKSLQEELKVEQAIRQIAADRIAKEEKARKDALNTSLLIKRNETDRFNFANKSLERELKLLQQANDLVEARAALETATIDRNLSNAEKAIALQQELADPALSKARREAAEKELQLTGLAGVKAEELEKRRLAAQKEKEKLEKRIAKDREAAERISLEFEIRKQELALKRAEIESRIALQRAKAEKASISAERAKAIATIRDPNELAQVLSALDQQAAAQDQVINLRQQEANLTQQQIEDQKVLSEQQREALKLRQKAAQVGRGEDPGGRRNSRIVNQGAVDRLNQEGALRQAQEAQRQAEQANKAAAEAAKKRAEQKATPENIIPEGVKKTFEKQFPKLPLNQQSGNIVKLNKSLDNAAQKFQEIGDKIATQNAPENASDPQGLTGVARQQNITVNNNFPDFNTERFAMRVNGN